MSESISPISFTKITDIPDGDYTFSGSVFKVNSNYYWIGRQATGHTAGGVVCKIEYNPLSKEIVNKATIITEAVNLQGLNGGIVANNIFVFMTKYTDPNFLDIGYRKSNDGLVGESYDSYVSLSAFLTYPSYNIHGIMMQIATDTYIMPWYEHDADVSGKWRPNFLKTIDNGDSWTNHNISDEVSPNDIGETSIIHLGGNNLFAVGRRRTSNFKLRQNYSTDLGATWGGWEVTNLGSSINQCMPYLYLNKKGLIDCAYGDRGTTWVRISIDNPLTIVSNPTSWSTPKDLYSSDSGFSWAPLGYPAVIEITQGRYLIFLSQEVKDTPLNTEADLYIGDGHLDDL